MKQIHEKFCGAASIACLLAIFVSAAVGQSTTNPAIPKGEITKYTFTSSRIFPGTVRDYWIYVPQQYDPAKPACLIVDQDDIQFRAPGVFDRLIQSGQMPVTIAVFVAPGRVTAPTTRALDRFNRSLEFDSLSDNYVHFLLDELLPDVETKTTTDGRAIHLSQSPNDRAIMGSSSGAICAFTAAWQRPDSFNRVFSAIGTYVDLRGGNIYPSLIRKFEPKPIRIFLQDGSTDHNAYGGDWWMANQEMERALTYAGYEVNHVWGTGDHDTRQATAIFADAMTWLWKDWPAPVKCGLGSEQLQQILIPGENWQLVPGHFTSAVSLCSDATGDVCFIDPAQNAVCKIGADGTFSMTTVDLTTASAMVFGPDGQYRLVNANSAVVCPTNAMYFTTSPSPGNSSLLEHQNAGCLPNTADSGLKFYGGITLSPDHSLVYADDKRSHWVYSYQIRMDGALVFKQKFFDLNVPDSEDDADAGGMCTDRDGRLYVSTNSGIQICDQAGRVIAIVPTPSGEVTGVAFCGANLDKLYAACGDKIYVRNLKVSGYLPFQPPIKPAPPKL